ncbi:MAG TPA: hypothetical protein VFO93_17575 [Hymenobacter sp.]|uniref:hypothetical protein n=1 Tax=Hymenobacter sp. TaxID=1898978 RepID=UPI002D7FD2E5|nr:hypothetical protein [Hymenobacter sp.]HET9505358.1 hypothetical protein [Hymenobacter sp.]
MSTELVSFNSWDEWQQVADGSLKLNVNIPISRLSGFEDDVWDFNDANKPRTLCFSANALRVNWVKYKEKIPESLLNSIRIVSFFIVKYPIVITNARKNSKGTLAPSSCCQSINMLLSFMAELCDQATVYVGEDKIPVRYVERLSDITIHDIKKAVENWSVTSLSNRIQKILSVFTSPLVKAYLPSIEENNSPVNWTVKDLKEINFPKKRQHPPGEGPGYRDKPLSDSLFIFLSKKATQDVVAFLKVTGQECQAPIPFSPEEHPIFSKYPNFKDIYQDFLILYDIRCETLVEAIKKGNKQAPRNKREYTLFKSKFNISYGDVKKIVERIQTAAKYLLLQFTGLRYSEAAMLRVGCLQKASSGEYVIKGTVIKGGAVNSLTGTDYWIACPIVRDALSILEKAAQATKNEHLFTTNLYAVEDRYDLPIMGTELNKQLSEYLYDIDEEAQFCIKQRLTKWRHNGVLEKNRITTHRLRHTLALQMSRANLSIPYISLHLKHIYQAYKSFQSVANVTTEYGGIGADIFQNAVGIRQAHREVVHSVYHPQSPIAGPGAEEFKRNRAYYFTGMQAAGRDVDEVLETLSVSGLPFADVGLGYCRGRKDIEKEDGEKEPPPCIGQLKCNPSRCKNAIIPQVKILMWKQVFLENHKRMNDPLLAHSKVECQQLMMEAQQVLTDLGVDIATL